MKLITIIIAITALSILPISAQKTSSDKALLKKLDASWEKAQLELDYNFMASLLDDDFIWVHNHASMTDTKTTLLNRVTKHLKTNHKKTKSRKSRDVNVIITGNTAVVSGFTLVNRDPKPVNYHFMRTYVKIDEKYYLLANQTMALPE